MIHGSLVGKQTQNLESIPKLKKKGKTDTAMDVTTKY